MLKKLKYLKEKLRAWNNAKKRSSSNSKVKFQEELIKLDTIIDKGEGTVDVVIEKYVVEAVTFFLCNGSFPKGGNSSFIALIPKKSDANMVKDFRPISLIGSLYKIIAKILENRLVTVLGDIVNKVQSAFVADRQILDGPFMLNKLVQWWSQTGDPLSPFMFILVMEGLHISFQRVVDAGHVLDCFYRASGLRINMNKSKLMGVAVEDDKVDQAAMKIGCVTLKAPFSYLGLKVRGSMSRIQSWNEIIDRVVARLSNWKMKTMSIGVASFEIYSLSFFNEIDHLGKKPIWVKWKSVLAFKEKGGLAVSSLYTLNRALMFKWVWRFFTQGSSLWARVIKAIHGVDEKIGKNVKSTFSSIWVDIIREAEKIKEYGIDLLKKLYPRLFSLETNKNVTVASKLSQSSLVSSFRRVPRGVAEQSQLDALMDKLHDVSLVNMRDRWVWSLEGLGDFFVASVRKLVDDNTLPEVSAKSRWVKVVPIKVNIHAWKVRLYCLPTRLNLSRRGLDIDSILCPMCENAVESTRHIFLRVI
ncbi:RNA-directed DNA polymerase, eukaryota, reverse transcriptase zinc-binding domain protein [Tanacetum coccineum]